MTAAPWTWPGSIVIRVIDGDSLIARLIRDIALYWDGNGPRPGG